MNGNHSLENHHQALREQLSRVNELRKLPFDDPRYKEWQAETGRILDLVFGRLESELHPCTTAFLNYRIPAHYTSTRPEMQQYYLNILQYQADLLKMYLEDIRESGGVSFTAPIRTT
jgi:hypothetical protein